MNKILMSAALAAGVLSSCSNNEMVEILPQTENPNAIKLTTGVYASKSAEVTTEGLITDNAMLVLVADDTNFGNNGVASFTYSGNEWVTQGGESWSGVDFSNGLNVYSVYENNNGSAAVDPHTGSLNEYHIESDVLFQRDLIYFGQLLHTIPSGGYINATYKHALTRMKMEDVTNHGATPSNLEYTYKMVTLKGFDGSAHATISAEDNTISWTNNDDSQDASYLYDLENQSIKENDLYIIPQKTAEHIFQKDPVAEGVEVLCISKVKTTRVAGWESVVDFKLENPGVTAVVLEKDGTEYTGAMYVKGVFPISDKEFVDGVYYNLQLNFGGASLLYADDKYFDEEGNKLEIKGETVTPKPEIGDPINPDPNGKIGLTVKVESWPSSPDEDIDTEDNDNY